MSARTLIAVACAAVLSACAGGSFVVNERYFPGGVLFVPLDRKVTVTIEGSGSEAVIVVNREPLKLNGNPGDTVTVTLRLKTPGFIFAPLQMSPDPLVWGAINKGPKFGETTCAFGKSRAHFRSETEYDSPSPWRRGPG